jgi:DNA polymerase-3 subunit alpha
MRGLLTKLGCGSYRELVAASSIIRPGVAQSGMMKEYIRRHHAPHSFDYPHPIFAEHLSETHGVMVYQEDVMKIAHHFAGLELGESDVLRRLMSGKKAQGDTFELLREKYFRNCRQRGYSDELSQEVWRQIESFAGYCFCKAHSASFAVESFQSLYLKTYYPDEFIVAVINNGGGFYRPEFYFHEARVQGAIVLAPCVNRGALETSLAKDRKIYVGFQHLHGLEVAGVAAFIANRRSGGPYRDLADFISRNELSNTQLDILIRIGAFRFTRKNKYELMWEKNALLEDRGSQQSSATPRLFGNTNGPEFKLPELTTGTYDQAFDEIELLGFPLCSPYDLLQQPERYNNGFLRADSLAEEVGKRVNILGYFVCRKGVRTKNNRLMAFGCWLDREGNYFDSVHFPPVLERYPLRGGGLYHLRGKVSTEFDFPSLEIEWMELLPQVLDGRYGD